MNVVSWPADRLAVLMVLCAALLMATTIRQTAFSRRRETGIMRLVGASNLTIQLPFIMESGVAADVGAGLAMGGSVCDGHATASPATSAPRSSTPPSRGIPTCVAIAPWVIGGVVIRARRDHPRWSPSAGTTKCLTDVADSPASVTALRSPSRALLPHGAPSPRPPR